MTSTLLSSHMHPQLPASPHPAGYPWARLLAACVVVRDLLLPPLHAQTSNPRPTPDASAPRYELRERHDPDGIGKFYMGREIAHVMGHQAADWLDRPEREQEERPEAMLDALSLKPGQHIADIGAGIGYHSARMAKRVGPSGKVYAVDVQREMLDKLARRMQDAGITNVVGILGSETSTQLPKGQIDLALMVDVYHEFSFPYEMMQSICDALKPGGRVAFVEFRIEDPKVPIKVLHKMSEAQVKKEMSSQPLRHLNTIGTLPWQHVVVFEKIRKPDTP